MYSAGPYSRLPYSGGVDERRVYFDMSFDLSAVFEFKIYLASTAGFATRPTDALRSQPFRPVLKSYEFSRDILSSEIGIYSSGVGKFAFSNADAFYDFLPRDYSFEGRGALFKAARRDGTYDASYAFGDLTATGWSLNKNEIVVDLVDSSYKLRVPMQPNLYKGTGGAEGGSDLKDKRKPLALGPCREVPAILLDRVKLAYQVSDGKIQGITGVRVRGFPLTKGADYLTYAAMVAATVPNGTFVTCNAGGYLRLNQVVQSDQDRITADVEGDSRDGYVTTIADQVRWAIRRRTELKDPADLAVASFAAVNAQQSAPVGRWFGPDDDVTVEQFIADHMGGNVGWGGFTRDDKFEVRLLAVPAGTPVQTFTRNDMIGDDGLDRLPLPDAYRPPPWLWRVMWGRCWSGPQSDLATSELITDAHREFVTQDYRLGSASRPAIKVDYKNARESDPVPAFYAIEADAIAAAQRRIDLFRTTRSLYRFLAPRSALRRNVGDLVRIVHRRFDLQNGRLAVIVSLADRIEVTDEGVIDYVEVTVYG